jgi:hypothetical protein
MSVHVRIGEAFESGESQPLFQARVAGTARNHYVFEHHGERRAAG